MNKIKYVRVPATYGDMYECVVQAAEKSGMKFCAFCFSKGVHPTTVKRWQNKSRVTVSGIKDFKKLIRPNTKTKKKSSTV